MWTSKYTSEPGYTIFHDGVARFTMSPPYGWDLRKFSEVAAKLETDVNTVVQILNGGDHG